MAERRQEGINFTLRVSSGISHIFYTFLPHSPSVLFVSFAVPVCSLNKIKAFIRKSNEAQAALVIVAVMPQQNPIKFNPAYKNSGKGCSSIPEDS